MPSSHKNWSGNLTYSAKTIHRPSSIEELQSIVANSSSIKAIGTKHCFNGIADTNTEHVSLENFDKIVALNPDKQTVTIEAGMRYGELGAYLHEKGFGLHNLASLPHISVVGACTTATHGSGVSNGNLSSAVCGIEFINGNGDLVELSWEKNPDTFPGVVVGLGALGIVTKLTLNIEPTYDVRQDIYENLPLAQLEENFGAITSSAYSVSLFTDWRSDGFHQVWQKRHIADAPDFKPAPEFFGATLAKENLHPLPGHSAVNCTEQMGTPGPWHERLPHFRLEFTPSSGDELQTEYFVARKDTYAALCSLFEIREQIAPLAFVTEVRTIAADDFWLSPCYQQDSVAIHFTWKPNEEKVRALLPTIEAKLEPFRAKPHWGKLFTMDTPKLRALYPKLSDFRKLAEKFDSAGKFRNEFLNTNVFD